MPPAAAVAPIAFDTLFRAFRFFVRDAMPMRRALPRNRDAENDAPAAQLMLPPFMPLLHPDAPRCLPFFRASALRLIFERALEDARQQKRLSSSAGVAAFCAAFSPALPADALPRRLP